MKNTFLTLVLASFLLLLGAGTASAKPLKERRPKLFNRLDANNNGVLGRRDLRIHRRRGDRDNNPPGRLGGRGTNWENPPGPRGGPGTSPNRRAWRDRDNNPPGPWGGRGTNWENPPGRRGGPGASPDRWWRR